MILLAAATFFSKGIAVQELPQAHSLLTPLLGNNASFVFAVALLFAGLASTVTSAMAGGTIFAGISGEPYDIRDNHSRVGVAVSLIGAFLVILFIGNHFKALVLSQMILSIQLPLTIFLQIYLTSSRKVMGKYVNKLYFTVLMLVIGAVVAVLNVLLFISFFS
jgi:manganese transport protein